MSFLFAPIAALALLALSIPSVGWAREASPTRLVCGHVVDPRTGTAAADVVIDVRGGRIVAMGPAAAALLSEPGASVHDLSGAWCLPGLVDAHSHLMIRSDQGLADNFLRRSSAAKTLAAMSNAQTMLQMGFTTLRVLGDMDYHFGLVDLREAIDRGQILGPRLLVAAHTLSPMGGHVDLHDIAPDCCDVAGTITPSGPDAMRDFVRREIKYGADWIKVAASGGLVSARDDPYRPALTAEELGAVIDEAHRHGRKVAVHAHGAETVRLAVAAGADSIEHATGLDAKTARMMARHGVYLVPTLHVIDWLLESEKGGIQGPSRRKAPAGALAARDAGFKAARQAGVPLAFGTDPIFPRGEVVREFEALARHGLTPAEVIASATTGAAELLGLESEIGLLATGRRADIIAVAHNPLEDVSALGRVSFVMVAGRVARPAPP